MTHCDKLTYDTHKDAANHCKGLRVKNGTSKANWRVYKCPHCQKFHVTTVGKKRLQPMVDYKIDAEEFLIIPPKKMEPAVKKICTKPTPATISTGKFMTDETKNFLKRLIDNQ